MRTVDVDWVHHQIETNRTAERLIKFFEFLDAHGGSLLDDSLAEETQDAHGVILDDAILLFRLRLVAFFAHDFH